MVRVFSGSAFENHGSRPKSKTTESRLLQAAAAGVPVIATAACGVDGVSNVTTVNAGESNSLRELLIDHIREEYFLTQATKISIPLSND